MCNGAKTSVDDRSLHCCNQYIPVSGIVIGGLDYINVPQKGKHWAPEINTKLGSLCQAGWDWISPGKRCKGVCFFDVTPAQSTLLVVPAFGSEEQSTATLIGVSVPSLGILHALGTQPTCVGGVLQQATLGLGGTFSERTLEYSKHGFGRLPNFAIGVN